MLEGLLGLEGLMWQGQPVLSAANEENKKLDESLKQKKIEAQKMKGNLELEKERGKLMRVHESDLWQEINYVQQVQNARRHELEIADNTRKLLDRERSRITQEMQALNKEIEALNIRQQTQGLTITNKSKQYEELEANIHLAEEAMEKWRSKSDDRSKDEEALLKYAYEDDDQIKALNLELQRLSKEAKGWKTALDDAGTDVFIAQSELDRVQTEFRNAHEERKEIISNWEKVLRQLQQRNEEINNLSKVIDSIREEEIILNQKLREQKLLLSSHIDNNKELERTIIEQENFAAKLRLEANEEDKRESDLRAEVETLKNISHYQAFQVQKARNELKQRNEEIMQRNEKLDQVKTAQAKLQEEINNLAKETFDTDHYIKQLETVLAKEKKELHAFETHYKIILDSVQHHAHGVKGLLFDEKNLEKQLKATKSSCRHFASHIKRLDNDRLQQQTMIYRIDLCIENLSNRIRVMEGELASDEARVQLEAEKAKLQAVLSENSSALDFITKQIKYMREKLVLSRKSLNLSKQQCSEVTNRIDFLDFYILNTRKTLKVSSEKKENLMVDQCLINLQLSRFKDLLRKRSETVLDLQKSQLELETVVKERMYELKSCRDMVQVEIHKEQEECYQTRRQLQEYNDKVAKLQTRYEVTLSALGISESEDTHADLLIKAEDEKRALQQERDKLVSTVIQRDDELQALRNTVWVIHSCLEQFRRSLNPPGMSQEESEKMMKLEEQQQQVDIQTHEATQKLQDLIQEISRIEVILKNCREKATYINHLFLDKRVAHESIANEINDIETKLKRAEKSNTRIIALALEKSNKSIIEDDIRIHQLRDLRKIATQLLFNGVTDDHVTYEELRKIFEEVNLPVPTRTQSSLSGRSSFVSSILTRKSQRSSSTSITSSASERSNKLERNIITPSVISLGSDLSESRTSTASSHSSKSRTSRKK